MNKPGRPKGTTKTDNRQSITIRLPVEIINQLPAILKRGRWIEQAIREKLSKPAEACHPTPPGADTQEVD